MGLRPMPAGALTLPPELDGRIFPVNDADLRLSDPVFSTVSMLEPTVIDPNPTVPVTRSVVDGGVLRQVQSVHVPWTYDQTTAPGDPAIGTAVFVDWNATLSDAPNIFGPRAQTEYFGPRGVFHLEGTVRYARNAGQNALTPIAFANQLMVANAPGADRTITPGWAFMNNQWFIAEGGHKLTLMYNDGAKGMAGFVDNQVFTVRDAGSTLDGVTNGYEALSFASRTYVGTDAALHAVIGFDMADINRHPDPPVGDVIPEIPAGLVSETIGLRVAHLAKGGTFGIGVQNASRTVLPPIGADLADETATIPTDASVVVVTNTSGGALTLVPSATAPSIQAGREGQVLTIVNGGEQRVTVPSGSQAANSGVRTEVALEPGEVVDLVFIDGSWHVRGEVVAEFPGVHPLFVPLAPAGARTFRSTHADGSMTGIDLVAAPGTWSSAAVRLMFEGEAAPRTVISSGAIGFSDGIDGAAGTYLSRLGDGSLRVGSISTALRGLEADVVQAGVRRGVKAITASTYAVVADDRRLTLTRDSASGTTISWPSDADAALPVGSEIPVCNLGAGAVAHQGGSGASVITSGTQQQGTRRVGVKVAADTWCVG